MKLASMMTGMTLIGLTTLSSGSLTFMGLQPLMVVAQERTEMKDATGLTAKAKIEMITKSKGQFGSGDQLRRFFFGDLEPVSVQPGGAGMVVNLYNKSNNVTFAYCATYDVVVAIKTGKVSQFPASEVK